MTINRFFAGGVAVALIGAIAMATQFSGLAQTLNASKQVPSVNFITPAGADTSGDAYEWMLQPQHRKSLNKQMLYVTAAQDGPLRASPNYPRALAAIQSFYNMGPQYAHAMLLDDDDALFLSYGRLYLLSHGRQPFFDPLLHSDFVTPTLEGFSLSPSGRVLAVTLGDGGTEIAQVQFINMKSGQRLPAQIEPVVVGGDAGFVWIDEATGMFRKADTTDLVNGDPSVGAEWTLFDVRTGREGASVFSADAAGVNAEFGDWFGVWVPKASNMAMGYLWRGNFIDAYVTDLDALLEGTPVWREVAGDIRVSDVEIWNDHYIITASDDLGNSSLYAEPVTGGLRRLIQRGDGETSFLYSTSMGDTAYIAARRGDRHVLFRLSQDLTQLVEVDLPFAGEIDFESFFSIAGTQASVTFDMSAPDRPWHLMRLDSDGPAYEIEPPMFGAQDDLSVLSEMSREQGFATSADGTRVPISLVYRDSGDAAGVRPTLIHAYGSYGETTMAGWNPSALAWASLDGVYAECHVRGSGYYGPNWHAGGSGADKHRSHEDMIACAEYLVDRGLSRPGDITALGGSAGGLIAGPVAITRPDLFGAAIVEFGVVNPLRGLDGPNGATQIDEFGDPRIPEDAAFMARSDSVELARTADALPDMFLCVGFQDSRVPHWMSARLAAVMAERDLGADIIIHADADAGHSCGFYAEDYQSATAKQFSWLLDRFDD